jgi:ABC-2 type transport system permease protein
VINPGAAVGGALGAGTLESILATPASPAAALLGLVAYDLSWALIKSAFLLVAGALLGVELHVAGLPTAMLAIVFLLLCHLGLGFGAAALVLAFRTAGPLPPAIITASTLLGGVYYSTSVIPSWLHHLSTWVPLTYSLRALRRGLLLGESPIVVAGDLARAGGFAAAGMGLGFLAMRLALRHARRAGLLTRE